MNMIKNPLLSVAFIRIPAFLFFIFIAGTVLPRDARCDDRLRGFVLGGGATLSEIDSLKNYHVNFIRYPINWVDADVSSVDQFYSWLDNELSNNVDPIIAHAKAIGARVLIDLHNPPGGYTDRARKPQFRLFVEKYDTHGKSWQDAFIEVWRRISTRYAGESGVWGYELLNEPADTKVISGVLNWPDLAKSTIAAVTAIDPLHMIVVNPTFGRINRLNTMKDLVGPKVAVSVLFYEPIPFTEQGIDIYKRTLKYPDPARGYTKANLDKKLKIAFNFAKKTKAQIIIHEFGTVWYANGSFEWIRDTTALFEKYKFNWLYFAFGGSVDIFDIRKPSRYDPKSPTKREKLIKKYFAKNKLF